MALAAATLFAAPTFDLVYPNAAMAWGQAQPKVDVYELQQRIDRLEVLIEKLEKLDTAAVPTQNGKPQQQQAYTPGMYNESTTIDRSKLYTELVAAIGLVFGLTFALEKSSLFPTIVRANQQYADIKEKMIEEGTWDGQVDYDQAPQVDPAAKMESMIDDAKGGLDMVQLQLMKEKQEKFLAEAAAKEAAWAEDLQEEEVEAPAFLSTDEINRMAAEAKAAKVDDAAEVAEAAEAAAPAEATAEEHSAPRADQPTEYETRTGVSWWTGVKA